VEEEALFKQKQGEGEGEGEGEWTQCSDFGHLNFFQIILLLITMLISINPCSALLLLRTPQHSSSPTTMHLDNSNIEDAGTQILADAFLRDGFSPRLQILEPSLESSL